MPQPSRSPIGAFVLIAAIVGIAAAAFAYTAGWFSPDRISPKMVVDAFSPPDKEPLGHRRNHAKGICFTGIFAANGNGAALSHATVLAKGEYPVVGRFNLGTTNPGVADATVRVRGIGIRIMPPDGQEWRTAMIDLPFFPVATPDAFYALLLASGSKDPDAMKNFAAAHPEIGNFGAWAKDAPWTGSYAEERYNSINSFVFVDGSGTEHVVRWSIVPAATPTPVPPERLAQRGADFLEEDIAERVAEAPQTWTMIVTIANPGDPTADPSKAWPDDRKSVQVGTLTVNEIEAESDGSCRDINFDPTVLPDGIHTSDDPFPAARSAAYSVSFNRRTAEEEDYPHIAPAAAAPPPSPTKQ